MIITIIGNNAVIECMNGHSSAEKVERLLAMKDVQRQLYCPERETAQCREWIAVWRLPEVLHEMIENHEKERDTEKDESTKEEKNS
jgi:hypothetical protein